MRIWAIVPGEHFPIHFWIISKITLFWFAILESLSPSSPRCPDSSIPKSLKFYSTRAAVYGFTDLYFSNILRFSFAFTGSTIQTIRHIISIKPITNIPWKLPILLTIFDPVIFIIILKILLKKQCSEESLEIIVVWFIEETHVSYIRHVFSEFHWDILAEFLQGRFLFHLRNQLLVFRFVTWF